MSDDNLLLFGCYLVNWFTLIFVIALSTKTKKVAIIHLGIQIAYTAFSMYQTAYHSGGGTALVTWFLWMIVIGIQWLSYLIYIGVVLWKRKQLKESN